MCTLMQKDAGIEMVAGIIATLAKYKENKPDDTTAAGDWRDAVEWRETLYDNFPDQINYQEVAAFVARMDKKYN